MTAIFVWSTLPVTIRKTKKELNIRISYYRPDKAVPVRSMKACGEELL
jgi:hypothetical protein